MPLAYVGLKTHENTVGTKKLEHKRRVILYSRDKLTTVPNWGLGLSQDELSQPSKICSGTRAPPKLGSHSESWFRLELCPSWDKIGAPHSLN